MEFSIDSVSHTNDVFFDFGTRTYCSFYNKIKTDIALVLYQNIKFGKQLNISKIISSVMC